MKKSVAARMSCKVKINGVVYNSIKEASASLSIPYYNVIYYLNNKKIKNFTRISKIQKRDGASKRKIDPIVYMACNNITNTVYIGYVSRRDHIKLSLMAAVKRPSFIGLFKSHNKEKGKKYKFEELVKFSNWTIIVTPVKDRKTGLLLKLKMIEDYKKQNPHVLVANRNMG